MAGKLDPGVALPGSAIPVTAYGGFHLEGKISGGDAPGRLPLISRFSRSPGCQPGDDAPLKAGVVPVNLPLRAGTFILVNWGGQKFPVHALSFPI